MGATETRTNPTKTQGSPQTEAKSTGLESYTPGKYPLKIQQKLNAKKTQDVISKWTKELSKRSSKGGMKTANG